MKTHSLFALALLSSVYAAEVQKCNLRGRWTNELGSNMTIQSINSNGLFSGVYQTAVSSTNSTITQSPVTGYQQFSSQPTFGFTVKWTFIDSVTVWTGQCFFNKKGEEILNTIWLLRSKLDTAAENWKGTSVGADTFTRRK